MRPPVRAHEVQPRLVHVAAEDVAGAAGAHALFRLRRSGDVDPAFRARGARVHEQDVVLPDGEGQPGEEGALPLAELRLRPDDGRLRAGVQRIGGRPIAAASWLPSTTTAPFAACCFDQVQHGHRIRAVADEVAEKRVALRAQRLAHARGRR